MPESNGFDEFVVVCCRLTKMVRVFPSRKDITAVELARKFIDEWHNRGFGVPEKIHLVFDSERYIISSRN